MHLLLLIELAFQCFIEKAPLPFLLESIRFCYIVGVFRHLIKTETY